MDRLGRSRLAHARNRLDVLAEEKLDGSVAVAALDVEVPFALVDAADDVVVLPVSAREAGVDGERHEGPSVRVADRHDREHADAALARNGTASREDVRGLLLGERPHETFLDLSLGPRAQRRLIAKPSANQKRAPICQRVANTAEHLVEALTAILLAERVKRSGIQESADDAEKLAKAEGCRLSNIRERLQPILASFSTAATTGGR